MILKRIKNDVLKYAHSISAFEHYVVICTGKRATICDRGLNPIHTVDKLKYVEKAYVSPDEKNVLLVSTANHFYIVSLTDFETKVVTVRSPYNGNLEGCGCWSYDGQAVYLSVQNSETAESSLRRYDISDMSYEDLLSDKYLVCGISPLMVSGKYLLIGYGRDKKQKRNADRNCLVLFDGKTYEEYPLTGKGMENFVFNSWEYDEKAGTFTLYGIESTFRCDIHGNNMETMPIPKKEKLTSSFSKVFDDIGLDKNAFDRVKSLSESFGLENMETDDTINKICNSADGKKVFVGTNYGLYVLDAETKEELYEEKISYGVHNIVEISAGVIAMETWHGVWLYEIKE